MSGLIDRIQGPTADTDERLRVLNVDDAATDEVLDALSSETARELYRALFEEPASPSEIGDRIDTSVQNVIYHLRNLEEAGLVEEVGTRYSEKGNEMSVYGPATDPLVLVGNRDLRSGIERSLTDVLAGLGLLGLASLLVQWGAERLASPERSGSSAVGPTAPTATGGGRDPLTRLVFQILEPGLIFFFGSLALIAVLVLVVRR